MQQAPNQVNASPSSQMGGFWDDTPSHKPLISKALGSVGRIGRIFRLPRAHTGLSLITSQLLIHMETSSQPSHKLPNLTISMVYRMNRSPIIVPFGRIEGNRAKSCLAWVLPALCTAVQRQRWISLERVLLSPKVFQLREP